MKTPKLKRVRNDFLFDPLSSFIHPERIKIGENVIIGEGTYISAEIRIGGIGNSRIQNTFS